jgi:hypothetical protein
MESIVALPLGLREQGHAAACRRYRQRQREHAPLRKRRTQAELAALADKPLAERTQEEKMAVRNHRREMTHRQKADAATARPISLAVLPAPSHAQPPALSPSLLHAASAALAACAALVLAAGASAAADERAELQSGEEDKNLLLMPSRRKWRTRWATQDQWGPAEADGHQHEERPNRHLQQKQGAEDGRSISSSSRSAAATAESDHPAAAAALLYAASAASIVRPPICAAAVDDHLSGVGFTATAVHAGADADADACADSDFDELLISHVQTDHEDSRSPATAYFVRAALLSESDLSSLLQRQSELQLSLSVAMKKSGCVRWRTLTNSTEATPPRGTSDASCREDDEVNASADSASASLGGRTHPGSPPVKATVVRSKRTFGVGRVTAFLQQ